ncbi:hypothetical protein GCWU000324_02773 [Kingella oralis ATCC 51147]|uniref:Uncharacterized protein n=1 Tax=Kingella oralis ATCC 51147 TaxID=629741 RepID=C4GM41_9NEIS|nr:hypothetical protein GCWU000324_02773 [Kingella oralis ATCC 51147]
MLKKFKLSTLKRQPENVLNAVSGCLLLLSKVLLLQIKFLNHV